MSLPTFAPLDSSCDYAIRDETVHRAGGPTPAPSPPFPDNAHDRDIAVQPVPRWNPFTDGRLGDIDERAMLWLWRDAHGPSLVVTNES